MQIKIQLGKLKFTVSLEEKIRQQRKTNQLEILPVKLKHIFALEQLPDHHRDPFDRLLIAQAFHEGISIITHDPIIKNYPVSIIW